MLNLRQIDKKFFLSGGWENVSRDAEYLSQLGIGCVLDLQYLPDDPAFNKQAKATIAPILEHFGIEYWVIPMYDGDNPNMSELFEEGFNAIDAWMAEKPRRKILVKCSTGVSRSVSMLMYFFAKKYGVEYDEAYAKVYINDSFPVYPAREFKDFLKTTFRHHELIQREDGQAECVCGKTGSVNMILNHIGKMRELNASQNSAS